MTLSELAAEWFIRMRDERLGMRHREDYVRWLKQSPTHIAESLRIQKIFTAIRATRSRGLSRAQE